jgi:phosphoribosyl 1,2-cyclic phosphodiesterase
MINVKFWGVRGSFPRSGKNFLQYGGHTSCVEIDVNGQIFLFDAGTGVISFYDDFKKRNYDKDLHLFLSHFHMDHVIGLPFFAPLYNQNHKLHLWSCSHDRQTSLELYLKTNLPSVMLPIPSDQISKAVVFHAFCVGDQFTFDSHINVQTIGLDHPGGAIGYRLNTYSRSICYITDLTHKVGHINEELVEFVKGADIMIYDATFSDENFAQYATWGHSTWQEGLRIAKKAGIKQYIPFHHDANRTDKELDAIQKELQKFDSLAQLAYEGMNLHLSDSEPYKSESSASS